MQEISLRPLPKQSNLAHINAHIDNQEIIHHK
ncbi:MAG: hypothetical protein US13_C0001G0092 [candidate division TM6 bacterium GW2011_GWE2_36_25]|nr:MAG: hypothetical protein US03_C0001G0112 [candidate division TM6 bacterium GW2011_GWF2_36_131]KKQ03752.1 MAG: hypothetical protein US13_C0001G0092 [candidate division TM6 bacterium GW2011_GWE2_36_25]KKQ19896.1 MAG: hypothetical protein US32_C0003G0013 [candidate division TM6 bacterium GW2011_GWA2_36_9]